MDSRYNDGDQESSDGNGSDLKNVYNMYFCSVDKTTFRYFFYGRLWFGSGSVLVRLRFGYGSVTVQLQFGY